MKTTQRIKCGNCGQAHGSSKEVRECYLESAANAAEAASEIAAEAANETALFGDAWPGAQQQVSNAKARANFEEARAKAIVQEESATEKQVAFLLKLAHERPMWADVENLHDDVIAKLTKAQASAKINEALAVEVEVKKPPKDGTRIDANTIPAGYYAVDSLTGNNDLDFFTVQHGKEGGRWEGVAFVKRVIGGHPDTPVRGAEARKAVDAILQAGWQQAAQRYGQEIGSCGICNRSLTDEDSRRYGIGPVCRAGQGW